MKLSQQMSCRKHYKRSQI